MGRYSQPLPGGVGDRQKSARQQGVKLGSHSGGAQALREARLSEGAVGLAWLGQAGFALRHAHHHLLIDPYLSDHLARKYAGSEFPHTRMMSAPIEAAEVHDLDFVLCSHRHSDHMDPGTLATLAENNSRCGFVVPRAELQSATAIGLGESQLIPVNDGDTIRGSESLEIHFIPAAHQTFKVNDRGEHHFLGFILKLGDLTLYHSGDCVVYDGLIERLREWRIDLALLPVNGRSERLTARGIPGNMTFEEARDLCLAARIGALIPHHFGMFDFNTVDPRELQRQIDRLDATFLQCVLPAVDRYYELTVS
jgi:L-ascorbate metabolism protein UlaG (beta-lactamase superfamily)